MVTSDFNRYFQIWQLRIFSPSGSKIPRVPYQSVNKLLKPSLKMLFSFYFFSRFSWFGTDRGDLHLPGKRTTAVSTRSAFTNTFTIHYSTIGGSGGGRQGRAPGGPNSFIFMQFSAKKMKNNSTFGSWRTPWGKSWIRH